MDQNLQTALTVAVPTFAVLLSSLLNNARLSDLRNTMDARFRSLEDTMNARFHSLEHKMDGRFQALDARFPSLDARFQSLEARLNALDARIADTRDLLRAEIRRVEEVLDVRLKHLEVPR